jgi:hypothetical protein
VLGLTAWLSKADYIVTPALLICLGLIGVGLYHRASVLRSSRSPTRQKS